MDIGRKIMVTGTAAVLAAQLCYGIASHKESQMMGDQDVYGGTYVSKPLLRQEEGSNKVFIYRMTRSNHTAQQLCDMLTSSNDALFGEAIRSIKPEGPIQSRDISYTDGKTPSIRLERPERYAPLESVQITGDAYVCMADSNWHD